jgi:hypothetical protein
MSLGFGSTTQGYVSLLFSFHLHYFSAPSEHFLPKELSQIFTPIPGAPHGTSSTNCCSVNAARIWINYTGICKSTSQLLFALLFSSVRALSTKRTISNFRSNSRRGTCNFLRCTAVRPMSLEMGSNMQGQVGLLLNFRLHYFSCPSEHFLRKELSQNFAPIPGGGHPTLFCRAEQSTPGSQEFQYTPASSRQTVQVKAEPSLSRVLRWSWMAAWYETTARRAEATS